MVHVLRDLPIAQNVLRESLAVVRKVENVKHVMFFFEDRLPAEFNDRPKAQCLVILFPPVPDEDRVGLRERRQLEFCRNGRSAGLRKRDSVACEKISTRTGE